MALDERWMDVDKLLEPAPKSREELHQRVVPEIAEARFEFPTTEFASYRSFVNVPEVTLPVTDQNGAELTPDIVVVDTPGNMLQILAAVETGDTVTEERAEQEWRPLALLPDAAFYLFLPVGYRAAAKRICKKLSIDVYGYRTLRYPPPGLGINDISGAPGINHPPMPPFARQLHRAALVTRGSY